MLEKIKKIILVVLILNLLLICVSCVNYKILQYRSYGIDYLENSDYEEALACFDEAIKMGDGAVGKLQFDLLQYKAECLFMLNKYDEAKKIYEILQQISNGNREYKELYENVSSITSLVDLKDAIDKNDLEKAEEMLNKLKELGLEHEKSVMFNQAVLYEKKAEWKNALNAFNYFLKQYPGDEAAIHEVEFINAQINTVQVKEIPKIETVEEKNDKLNKNNAKKTNN